MTKAEVAAKIMQKTGMPRKQSLEALEIFLRCIKTALKEGGKVSLVGFGTFYIKSKRSRSGRNPKTGDKIGIPEKRVPVFKPGKAFRDSVNKG